MRIIGPISKHDYLLSLVHLHRDSCDYGRGFLRFDQPRTFVAILSHFGNICFCTPDQCPKNISSESSRRRIVSTITLFFGDQPYWGHRVFELGVGPQPIPKKDLNSKKLAKTISIAVSDATMREQAADLGSKIRTENGVSKAVEVLERTFNSA